MKYGCQFEIQIKTVMVIPKRNDGSLLRTESGHKKREMIEIISLKALVLLVSPDCLHDNILPP